MEHPEDALPDGFVDELLDRKQASAYLESIGVRRKPATLARLHSTGGDGPPCVHEGRKPLYPKRCLHEWGMSRLSLMRRSPGESSAAHSAGAPSSNAADCAP